MRFILLFIWMVGFPVMALTGLDVMTKVQDEAQKKTTRKAVVDMRIYDKKDRERTRYFNYWTKHTDGDEKRLIKFFRPKNVKGTALLTRSVSGHDDKIQWVYLPAVKSLKQLTSSDKNKSFMGSDFTYSDIAGRKLTQDRHTLVKETDTHYFIESQPVNPDGSYSKIRYVISRSFNVITKAIFYDLKGVKLKTLTNTKVSTINGVNIVMNSEMVNHQTQGKTYLTVQSMTVGDKINDDLLSIKGLKIR
ncbi:MAG: outer membrane lipoprotein-sorting protein [Candidatus Marinamargulisbacteria bacterium]